jgi:hypothetical protein
MEFVLPMFVTEILIFEGDVGTVLILHLIAFLKIEIRIFSPKQEIRDVRRTFSNVFYVATRRENPKHV